MPSTDPLSGPGRLVSLDVFRGLTIAGMIIVNNPGSWSAIYPPLKHAEWHGWTPTDLIFPFFLFIVGVSMVFSFAKRRKSGHDTLKLAKHVAVRSVLLFALGMILTGFPDYYFDNKLILDVLQRIAVVYLFSGLMILTLSPKGQAIAGAGLLVVYWLLMFLIPVPGYGRGVLEWQGSVWQYVDNLILNGWHSHPEGILSLIPSISTVLFGSLTGTWLMTQANTAEKIAGMFAAGIVAMGVGTILDVWFPINKLLWSSSYVIFTGGFALVVLALCMWIIDFKGLAGWSKPFRVFGMNAIATFFLASFVGRVVGIIRLGGGEGGDGVALKSWIYQNCFASWLSEVNASLAFALVYTILWWGIMNEFHRRRIFIKL